ncbi:uncharacterized protein LOC123896630 [Trifolium pratense]|uniref:uncharacterized protein LOC123896630 n=1 Tax=Trifolium pratense TaxID=57577 RepID=UPI001E6916EB|nr:uncharacterized protein LOC123896630 [Trifolium pratense]
MDTSLSFSRLLSSSTTTSLLSPKTKTLSSNFTLPLKLNRFNPKPLRFSTSSKISATISVGDKLPESTFSYLDPASEVQTITVSDLTKGKKAVLFAVPGAFTPTCSQKHCQLIMCDCSSLIGCFRFVFQKLCARKLILIMGILCGFVSSNWAESVIQFDFEMATQFDMLCDVLPGHNSWKFKVRVLRMWAISSFMKPNELNSMEMVLIDEKGGKIHALIRKELDLWKLKIPSKIYNHTISAETTKVSANSSDEKAITIELHVQGFYKLFVQPLAGLQPIPTESDFIVSPIYKYSFKIPLFYLSILSFILSRRLANLPISKDLANYIEPYIVENCISMGQQFGEKEFKIVFYIEVVEIDLADCEDCDDYRRRGIV